jgi:lipoate-protein ligase B
VTWHGFALNVGPDIRGFDAITPCGLGGVRMTSVALEGGSPEVVAVAPIVRRCFMGGFGYTEAVPLAWGSTPDMEATA